MFRKWVPRETDGSISWSRLCMGGGVLILVAWILTFILAAFGILAWDLIAGHMEWAKDVLPYTFAPYGANQLRRGISERSHTPAVLSTPVEE